MIFGRSTLRFWYGSLKRKLCKLLYNISIINYNLIFCRSNILQGYRSLQNLHDYFISCSRRVMFLVFSVLLHVFIIYYYMFILSFYAFLLCPSLHYFLSPFLKISAFGFPINNYILSNKSWNQNWNIFRTTLPTIL